MFSLNRVQALDALSPFGLELGKKFNLSDVQSFKPSDDLSCFRTGEIYSLYSIEGSVDYTTFFTGKGGCHLDGINHSASFVPKQKNFNIDFSQYRFDYSPITKTVFSVKAREGISGEENCDDNYKAFKLVLTDKYGQPVSEDEFESGEFNQYSSVFKYNDVAIQLACSYLTNVEKIKLYRNRYGGGLEILYLLFNKPLLSELKKEFEIFIQNRKDYTLELLKQTVDDTGL